MEESVNSGEIISINSSDSHFAASIQAIYPEIAKREFPNPDLKKAFLEALTNGFAQYIIPEVTDILDQSSKTENQLSIIAESIMVIKELVSNAFQTESLVKELQEIENEINTSFNRDLHKPRN